MRAIASHPVEGHVSPAFESVHEAFVENFARRGELGGACSVYHHGEKVVDLWGGIRNKQTGEAWERDTMVVIHSATKGLAAMTLALAHSRGWLDYEERVATYWPEFAQQGKETITVRSSWRIRPDSSRSTNPSIAASSPTSIASRWLARRSRHGVGRARRITPHARLLRGELLRRVDPRHRSLGQFFQDEIVSPLGENVHPLAGGSNARLATLSPPSVSTC